MSLPPPAAAQPSQIIASTVASTTSTTSHTERSSMLDVGSHVRFWTIAVGGLALDLASKEWAFQTLRQGGRRTLIPSMLEFQTMFNPGALFGIGQGRTTLFLVASVLALLLVLWMFAQSSPRRRVLQIALGGILAGALGNMYDRVFVKLIPFAFTTPTGRTVPYYATVEAQGDGARVCEYPPTDASLSRVLTAAERERLPEPVGYVRDFIKIDTTMPNWSSLPAWMRGRELWPWVFNVADMLLVGGVGILAIHLWRDRRPGSEAHGDGSPRPPSLDSAGASA